MTTSSDNELLARSVRGDQLAFAELFDRHAVSVALYARRATRHSQDAQDVLQETFLTAWRKRADIRLSSDSLLPWLIVSCRNHSSNLARKNSLRVTVPLLEADLVDATDPLTRVQHLEDLSWIQENIAAMSELDRRLIELCLFDGRTYQEAAALVGVGVGPIAKRIHRVRARLRAQRAARQGEEPA